MRKLVSLFFGIWILSGQANAQSGFEIIPSLSRTYTNSLSYNNCSGTVGPAPTADLALIYHPSPAWGIELNFMGFTPKAYLNNANESVRAYTQSTINVSRISAGLNYSLPLKKFRPFAGILLGASRAATTVPYVEGSHTSFSKILQAGTAYYFSSHIGLRLNIRATISQDIPDNSAWFNVDGSGDGFPTFAIGAPSKTNMMQWNIGLGLIVRLMASNKRKAH